MSAVTFASKLKKDGSLVMPKEVAEQLGLHPGDQVQVWVEVANGATPIKEPDQEAIQAKFERFFDNLNTLTFEKPTHYPNGDLSEVAFTQVMDEKYQKLGFKP